MHLTSNTPLNFDVVGIRRAMCATFTLQSDPPDKNFQTFPTLSNINPKIPLYIFFSCIILTQRTSFSCLSRNPQIAAFSKSLGRKYRNFRNPAHAHAVQRPRETARRSLRVECSRFQGYYMSLRALSIYMPCIVERRVYMPMPPL